VALPSFDIAILSTEADVAPFIDHVQLAADQETEALGFLPEPVYREAAQQGKLLVAVVAQEDLTRSYAGHLLYGGAFPQTRIFQVYVVPAFRKHGVGRRLVEAIVRRAEDSQFMSIVAQVADDLSANKFWEALNFELVRTKRGGRTTGRLINVRTRELSTPRLFGWGTTPRPHTAQDLRLISRLFEMSPIYVVDLNILLDLLRKRANANEVARILRASFNNLVRLAVTQEFVRELERSSIPAQSDPLLELALRLPRLTTPPPEVVSAIVAVLRSAIFPNAACGGLRVQDESDLVHLATAIHHEASGFITGEKAILRARAALQSRYSLDVIGASEFADTVELLDSEICAEVRATSTGTALEGRPVRPNDIESIEKFMARLRVPQQLLKDALRADHPGRSRRRTIVTSEIGVLAFACWDLPSPVHPHVDAFLCVDEDHGAALLAADFLMDSMSRVALYANPIQLTLRLLPGHVITKRVAAAHGFRPPANEPSSATLQKIAVGCAVTPQNWKTVAEQLRRGMDVDLPSQMPPFQSFEQPLEIGSPAGERVTIPLEHLETLLSPIVFLLPGRPGVIAPIRRVYASELIGGDKQRSLLAAPEASLLHERIYFSGPRTGAVLKKGLPLLFYESARKGGSASVIAVARIIKTELLSKELAIKDLSRRGVLDKKSLRNISLSRTLLATTIDNIMRFRCPIGLSRLRALDVMDGANLVTARQLEPFQVMQLVEEGFS
jgi:GNAT superfamily N-acetyltransferase/predicted nucleic acid-binding protein